MSCIIFFIGDRRKAAWSAYERGLWYNVRMKEKFHSAIPKDHTLCGELGWSHYRLLFTVENEEARQYYA